MVLVTDSAPSHSVVGFGRATVDYIALLLAVLV
jgi:hypothetical protein